MADGVILAELLHNFDAVATSGRLECREQPSPALRPSRGTESNGRTRSKPFLNPTLRLESRDRQRPTGESPLLAIGSVYEQGDFV